MTSSLAPSTPRKVNKARDRQPDENQPHVGTSLDGVKLSPRRGGKASDKQTPVRKASKTKGRNLKISSDLVLPVTPVKAKSRPSKNVNSVTSKNKKYIPKISRDLMPPPTPSKPAAQPARKKFGITYKRTRCKLALPQLLMPPPTPLKMTAEPTCKMFGKTYRRTRGKMTLPRLLSTPGRVDVAKRVDTDAEEKWKEERDLFHGRVVWFLAHTSRIQGNRPFKMWKGSVLDSVVGAYLTQNVSDYLSSTAFMNLAATFPPQPSDSNVELQKGKSVQVFDDDETPRQKIVMNPYKKLMESLESGNESDLKVQSETQKTKFKDERLKRKRKRKLKNEGKPGASSSRHVRGPKRGRTNKRRKIEFSDWTSLREEALRNGASFDHTDNIIDLVDWNEVGKSNEDKIEEAIEGRGMHKVLAKRIKDFLRKLAEQGSLNLEWLRLVPGEDGEKVKEYLRSIHGIGLKSAECVRLLTLQQPAFPVDTNIGRICVRLGWVTLDLDLLPESLQFHLLEKYPAVDSIQNYLWPRLCTLDYETLYELHCQMITFGKAICTKRNPNCPACPFREECLYFKSAFPSGRQALPASKERDPKASTTRLCTEHQVYELPDSHHLLIGMDRRAQDDPSPYLLAVWDSGEVPKIREKSKPTPGCSNSRCTDEKCDGSETVKGTLLIPCKTAVGGGFPLNGTYFQDNEVFVDHCSSVVPIDVPRMSICHLPKRTLYCGSSMTTLCRGLTTDAIQLLFLKGTRLMLLHSQSNNSET